MKTSVIGFPRIGRQRELKFATERYFKKELTAAKLQEIAVQLRLQHWTDQANCQIDWIASNDFSFYDNVLDMAVLLNIIPKRYQALVLSPLDTYFAMARGHQDQNGDVHALSMKKWFNTNYHYIVPEIEDQVQIRLVGTKPFDEWIEAKKAGFDTKSTLIGPYTFIKSLCFTGTLGIPDILSPLIEAYQEILIRLSGLGTCWVQFEEPALVMDMTPADVSLYTELYQNILTAKKNCKVLLQTYFGDIRNCYQETLALSFDGIGLDFIEGEQSLQLIQSHGFTTAKTLFAGVINGKNIWKNHHQKSISILQELTLYTGQLVASTSCSLLHLPYTLESEQQLNEAVKQTLCFAKEKLIELTELKDISVNNHPFSHPLYIKNQQFWQQHKQPENLVVQDLINTLTTQDFIRTPTFKEREHLQKKHWQLPPFPTTTIGSFPQTADVRANRRAFKNGTRSVQDYQKFNKQKIAACIRLQEEIGLDVLVHGEYERNDMVEYFGELLEGFVFTEQGWVQSYGTRCVKPPIIWGDVSRKEPLTLEYTVFAQTCTRLPVKGMLTGPVTILNWSFPREDISLKQTALQIALAIRAEVLELEQNNIQMIQVDEAALREKLPLRKSDWHRDYLDWAIPAFRLVHSGVKPETQIHTHMCYSEFADIIAEIDALDADVISFEASRSNLQLIDALTDFHFQTQIGPGIYDIHSPRIPQTDELMAVLTKILAKVPAQKLWINPDCGLKTRQEEETIASLRNLVTAAKKLRKKHFADSHLSAEQ